MSESRDDAYAGPRCSSMGSAMADRPLRNARVSADARADGCADRTAYRSADDRAVGGADDRSLLGPIHLLPSRAAREHGHRSDCNG